MKLLFLLLIPFLIFGQTDWSDQTVNYPDSLDNTTSLFRAASGQIISSSDFNKVMRALYLMQGKMGVLSTDSLYSTAEVNSNIGDTATVLRSDIGDTATAHDATLRSDISDSLQWTKTGTSLSYNAGVSVLKTTPGNSLFHVGANGVSSAYPGYSLGHDYSTDNQDGHGYVDESDITGDTISYASFDANVTYAGDGDNISAGHYNGFQIRSTYDPNASDTLDYFRGYRTNMAIDTGHINNVVLFDADVIRKVGNGNGTVGKQYAFYAGNLTSADSNWAFFAENGAAHFTDEGFSVGLPSSGMAETSHLFHVYDGASGANFGTGKQFVLESNDHTTVQIGSPTNKFCTLGFSDAGGAVGFVRYTHVDDELIFKAASDEYMTIGDNGTRIYNDLSIGNGENYGNHHLSIYHGTPELALTETDINTDFSSAAQATDSAAIWLRVQAGVALLRMKDENGNNTFYVNDSNVTIAGDLTIVGALSKGSGTFKIDHPTKKDYDLYHSFVESPTAGENLYRYQIESKMDGETIILNLPDYFSALNENPQVWVNAVGIFADAYGYVNKNKLFIVCEKPGLYNVLCIGTRKDDLAVKNWKGSERKKK